MTFPYKEFILDLDTDKLLNSIRQSTSKRISDKRGDYLAQKFILLANQSHCPTVHPRKIQQ